MKQLIIDKIDSLVNQGYRVEDTSIGYKIGELHAYKGDDFYPLFTVARTDLDNIDSKEIYDYLQSIYEKQFIQYLKED